MTKTTWLFLYEGRTQLRSVKFGLINHDNDEAPIQNMYHCCHNVTTDSNSVQTLGHVSSTGVLQRNNCYYRFYLLWSSYYQQTARNSANQKRSIFPNL